MNNYSMTYSLFASYRNKKVLVKYVVDNLLMCGIRINTHTHTHTHTHILTVYLRALIYSFPLKLQSGARAVLQALSCVYVAANIYLSTIKTVIC